jgi:hypothetical protein
MDYRPNPELDPKPVPVVDRAKETPEVLGADMIQIYYNINTVWLSQVKSFLSSPPSKKS